MTKLSFLLPIFLLGIVQSVSAQISISCQPTKEIYVAHEPVEVSISILNRAGRDLVLNGKDGGPWLTFNVTDSQGHMVSPRQARDFEPVFIPAGQVLKRTFPLNSLYPLSRKGLYRFHANVYFAPNNRYFSSKPESIQISEGVPFWSQVVGIPEGNDNEGEYRRFTLMTFHNGAEKQLYIRVQDEESGTVLSTFPLGQVIMVREPQERVDRDNRLHILHMGAPRTYQHTVIDPNGRVISTDVYRETGTGRPNLSALESGDIMVAGGVSEAEEAAQGIDSNIHKLSERPPGLPVLDQ